MITIWHNNKCSKSQEAKTILEKNNVDFKIFQYLIENLTKEMILDVIKYLNIADIRDMLRSGDELYTRLDIANLTKTQDEIISLVLQNKILIQSPIIIKNNKAIIARPMENLTNLLKN
jgi:arsenate reductase